MLSLHTGIISFPDHFKNRIYSFVTHSLGEDLLISSKTITTLETFLFLGKNSFIFDWSIFNTSLKN